VDNIKMDLKEVEWEGMDWVHVAQNKKWYKKKKKPEKELWTKCWLYEGTFDTRKIPRITHSMPGLFCLMADDAVSATVAVCYEPASTYFSSMTVTSIFHASTFQDVATW